MGELIAPLPHRWTLDSDCMVSVDIGAIHIICNDAALAWIHACNHRCSVYVRCAGINRMLIAKSDSFAGKLRKRRSCFLADEIRAHSIPHNDDDMPVVESWCLRGKWNDA